MEEDAYGIPKPKDTPSLRAHAAAGALRGLRPEGRAAGLWRRLLRPHAGHAAAAAVHGGLAYAHGFVPWLQAEPHDVPLDAVLTDEGLAWQRRLTARCGGGSGRRARPAGGRFPATAR